MARPNSQALDCALEACECKQGCEPAACRALQMVSDEFQGADVESLQAASSGASYKWASQEMAHAPDLSAASMATGRTVNDGDISMLQEQVISKAKVDA